MSTRTFLKVPVTVVFCLQVFMGSPIKRNAPRSMNLCLLHLQAHSNQMSLCYDLLHEKQVINIFLKAPFYLIYAFLKTYITWTNYKWSSLFISPPKMPSVFQNLDSLMHLDQGILAFLGTFKKCFVVLGNASRQGVLVFLYAH